jgi:hypothetical protein
MKRIYLSVITALFSVLTFAQDNGGGSSTTVNISKSSTSFPWIWVVVGVIVLILLIAMLSGGRGGSDTVVEKKTVIKE